jgi:hypothetical protein
MKRTPARLLVVLFLPCLLAPAAEAEETVISLKVASGTVAKDRDSRVWAVPVKCNDVETDFTWGCGWYTVVSESFANKAGLKPEKDDETAPIIAGDGKSLFLGKAKADVSFAGRRASSDVRIMRDSEFNKGMIGTIGYEIARQFQWEINPEKQTLTLRAPGAQVTGKTLAVIKLKDDGENLFLPAKARNTEIALALAPHASDIQAAPDLQKAWDIATGQEAEEKGVFGGQRTRKLSGAKDYIELSPEVREAGLTVILIGNKDKPEETPDARSGLGASFLNRFIYRVDAQANMFVVVSRANVPVPEPKARTPAQLPR